MDSFEFSFRFHWQFLLGFMLLIPNSHLKAQSPQLLPQQKFPNTVPAGDYSGITRIKENQYAVVDDKSAEEGFYLMTIQLDSLKGTIQTIEVDTFITCHRPNRDQEGIAYRPSTQTLFISGEKDNRIVEYTLDGNATGKELNISEAYRKTRGNYGYESISYDSITNHFWTMTESTLPADGEASNSSNATRNLLRLQCYNDSLQQAGEWWYRMDSPSISNRSAQIYAMGVSEICALPDGRILILEREVFVPKLKMGSFANCKLYAVRPQGAISSIDLPLHKTLISKWKTSITMLHQDMANYEGICLGPRLADGRQTLILCADSQHQQKGLLRDWFRVIIL